MKIIYAKFLFFLIEYTYFSLSAASWNPKDIVKNITKNVKNDCIFGVKSVQLILYNNEFPYGEEIGLQEVCNIDSSKPVVFFVHGFLSSPNYTGSYELITQFVKRNCTVYSLDWAQGACENGIPLLKFLEYPFAVNNTREVGELMAKYIKIVVKKCKVPLANILLIGHSLGAHICGFAAKKIQTTFNSTLPRIIAADPANPLFGKNKCSKRLCKTDARSVIVFHTSILGIQHPIGHCDFWFNGGKNQPGCGIDISCSHSRSVVFQTLMLQNDDNGYDYGYSGVNKTLVPKEPDSKTTNCIFLDSRIYVEDYIAKGAYDVFSTQKYPYCVKNTFSCNNK